MISKILRKVTGHMERKFSETPVGVELLIRYLSIWLRRIRHFLRTNYRWYYHDS